MSARNSALRFFCVAIVLVSVFAAVVAVACDTPVYRYAMYRWQPTPYEIYFFHTEAAGEREQKTRKSIEDAVGGDSGEQANVVYIPVNLKEDADLVGVPPDVKNAWNKNKDVADSTHMVVSPQGIEIFTGKLDSMAVASLVNSPVRKKLGLQLEQGKAVVFLLLECGDAKADAEADKVLKKLVADVAGGKLNLYSGPTDQFAPKKKPKAEVNDKADKKKKSAEPAKTEVGYLRVGRKDKSERWLVRQLMSVEDDLGEFVDKPMVFAIYGRARALPPFIGRGISSDNLIDCVEFVTGACSCTVKEQNPGVDLLVRYDWEAASAKVAEKFGAEEGNENQFGIEEFFPDLVIGPQKGIPDEFKAPPKKDNSKDSTQDPPDDQPMPKTIDPDTSGEQDSTDSQSKIDNENSNATAKTTDVDPDVKNTDSTRTVAVGDPLDVPANVAAGNGNKLSGKEATPTADPSKDASIKSSAKTAEVVALTERTDSSVASPVAEPGPKNTQVMIVTIGLGVSVVLFLLIGATFVLFKGN